MSVPYSITMRVFKYLPDRLFGFARNDDGLEVYFQLGWFDPHSDTLPHDPPLCKGCPGCVWQSTPGPVLGERVKVDLDFDPASPPKLEGGSPRARRVHRLNPVLSLTGIVESFEEYRGYGFVKGVDGLSYYLHRSEVLGGYLPTPGDRIRFCSGTRQARPRACYVTACPGS